MERFILIILMVLSLSSHATELDQIFNVIKYVESENKVDAVGDGGKAFGVVQIHKICVADINRIYKTNYTHQDAFDETCSREMFMLYISAGIKRYKRKYNKDPTESQIVRMWNGGLYKGYLYKDTMKYWLKYKIWKKYLENNKGLRC